MGEHQLDKLGVAGSSPARRIGEVYFGIGAVAWVLMSSVVFNRMFFRARLAPALLPTMAIEPAPPGIAGNAYFGLHPAAGPVALGLGGYAAFMVVAQLRLLPLAAVSALIAAIASRTLLALTRGELLPSATSGPEAVAGPGRQALRGAL